MKRIILSLLLLMGVVGVGVAGSKGGVDIAAKTAEVVAKEYSFSASQQEFIKSSLNDYLAESKKIKAQFKEDKEGGKAATNKLNSSFNKKLSSELGKEDIGKTVLKKRSEIVKAQKTQN